LQCGEPTVDGLLSGDPAVPPLKEGDSSSSVGYVQDLLRGHGYNALPDPRVSGYGSYGPITARAVADYCLRNKLDGGAGTDSAVLRDLTTRPAPEAVFSPAYLPLVLDIPFSSLFETRGAFHTLNLNTDRCGVSFGILQWSQRPGQLHSILEAGATESPASWQAIMGDSGILDYTARPDGGLNAEGWAIDPAFELTKDPWKTKLLKLGADPEMQRAQFHLAASSYQAQLQRIESWAEGPKSERLLAFLLDLVNQFGPGRVARQFTTLAATGIAEEAIMQKLEDAFTALSRPEFQPQVRARREFFRTTPLLSDQPPPTTA
jgi:hypothetical protein